MINKSENKIILNFILHGKANAGRAINKHTVLTEGNKTGR
jgi:hypothetical protein